MDIRPALRRGFLTGVVAVITVLLGLTGLVGTIAKGWLHLPSQVAGAWALLLLVALWAGAGSVRRCGCQSWGQALAAGLLAGMAHGFLLGAFTWWAASAVASGAKVRQWLAQITPDATQALTLGRAPLAGGAILCGAVVLAALVGALLGHVSARYRWREGLRGGWQSLTDGVSSFPALRDAAGSSWLRYVLISLALGLLLAAPLLIGQYWNYVFGTVGLYIILGLGLNIVVGLAGILNLGYVAFFAIGAYTVALLTAPQPHGIRMDFWLALPIGVILAVVVGVLLCIPVLRTRGDYLAIVTLGFGEIIRILAKSDALTDFTGGPKGVRDIGGPVLPGLNLRLPGGLHLQWPRISLQSELGYVYLIIIGIVLVAFITYRLQSSRVGRAWMAMREDEDVARAMGIHTLKYKILAFAIGAAFAGLAGVIFASRNRFSGPEDFTLLVSINVLCLVIIGGMGSIPGVIVGALVLKGLPELLRELDDYRFLVFGALLVVMMILRPEGLWPSARGRLELQRKAEEPTEIGLK